MTTRDAHTPPGGWPAVGLIGAGLTALMIGGMSILGAYAPPPAPRATQELTEGIDKYLWVDETNPQAQILFEGDMMQGIDSCNQFAGEVEVGAKSIEVGRVIITRQLCLDEASVDTQQAFRALFATGFTPKSAHAVIHGTVEEPKLTVTIPTQRLPKELDNARIDAAELTFIGIPLEAFAQR